MDNIMNTINSYLPEGMKLESYLLTALVLVAAVLILGLIGRAIFGKKSTINQSVSGAISILFIYALTIVIYSCGIGLSFLTSPLPFISIQGEYMQIFQFAGANYTEICYQVLNMIILAFLANLANSWLPMGKKVISWLFFRAIAVILAMVLHVIVNSLMVSFLPEGLLMYAPVVLLALLVLMMLVGGLKLLVGAVLTTVNPLIGILYTFFFANIVGKQLSKAVLTTVILSGIVYALNYFGVASIYIAAAALTAYIPFVALLLLAWYIVGHLL